MGTSETEAKVMEQKKKTQKACTSHESKKQDEGRSQTDSRRFGFNEAAERPGHRTASADGPPSVAAEGRRRQRDAARRPRQRESVSQREGRRLSPQQRAKTKDNLGPWPRSQSAADRKSVVPKAAWRTDRGRK